MVTKLNPKVITDDMMYEGSDLSASFVPTAEIDAWSKEYEQEMRSDLERIKEDKMWGEIRRLALTNPTLQEAIDHVIMIYKLSKEYNDV
jgi:pilus assembly protein TadC